MGFKNRNSMEDLREHAAQARRMARRQYSERHLGHYLLGEVPQEWDDDMEFATGVTNIADIEAELAAPHSGDQKSDELEPGYFLVKVAKTERAAWLSWISVGRARNNDIVLRHSSISKLHAQIHTEADTAGPKPRFWVIDAGSANGTTVNGQVQTPGSPLVVRPGDTITFGDIACRFLDGGRLYDELRKLPRDVQIAF
jgi:hypothetical protein